MDVNFAVIKKKEFYSSMDIQIIKELGSSWNAKDCNSVIVGKAKLKMGIWEIYTKPELFKNVIQSMLEYNAALPLYSKTKVNRLESAQHFTK